jgi:manganese/zinc/iron transport system permease protein
MLSYNTLVVLGGVAAVGFAAGVVGSLGLLRKRPLVADAAAHATLVGAAVAFLLTGRRDLPTLLAGALVSALAGLAAVVAVRRFTRTRDDAATALVIGVSFGAGIALVSGITARGLPGGAGLEQFLLGHTAALTARDATLLACVSCVAVLCIWAVLKETTLVAFDASFAAASGWPVMLIDGLVVGLVAVMVVVGLPAAGAVLVTALVLIPPVAARQWTDRVTVMIVLAGLFGLIAAVVGVAVSTAAPRLSTGPLVVLAAAVIFAVSFVAAPHRGWVARTWQARRLARDWTRGRVLDACFRAAGESDGFARADVETLLGLESVRERRGIDGAWNELVRSGLVEPSPTGAGATTMAAAAARWRLTGAGLTAARERSRRLAAWATVFDAAANDARAGLTLDLPAPEDVIEPDVLRASGVGADRG